MASDEARPRIVFMGSPDFAVASAEQLHRSEIEFAAVVTTPDKPAGRGLKVRESPVKLWAREKGVPVLQPEDLRDPEFLNQLQRLQAEYFVVVAFRILPREVFTLPPGGTINLHASLLPKYRGAAPINWAIIQGETETGVTTILIDEKVDSGDILMQWHVPIGEDETFGELYERLKKIGAELLAETVQKYHRGEIKPRKQIGPATKAPKITPELCRIDWQQPAHQIRNLVRGLCPQPAAFTFWQGRRLKIFKCAVAEADTNEAHTPGEIVQAEAKNGILKIRCGTGSVLLQEIQLEGKRRMSTEEFLRGYPVQAGDILG